MLTRLIALLRQRWSAIANPTSDPLSKQTLRVAIALCVLQISTLMLAFETQFSFESWLRSASLACGIVGTALTGYGLVQTVRWLMRD